MSGTVPPDVKETFPGDWDQLLPWVLFAYREVPVQGLMFSPFDIVFGRNIKGVLQLIKNSWLKDDMPEKVCSKNVIDYVLQLFIHSRIYIAPLQGNYSEVLPTPARSKRTVFN